MLNADTKRYLLKLIITIITYYHSMLQRTDSKRRMDVPRITTQLVYISSLILDKKYFSLLMLTFFRSAEDRGRFSRCASKSSFQTWRQSILLTKNHQRYLMKLIIQIKTYFNSKLRRTDSKHRADVLWITT
jgi:hypothetical protein